MMFGNSITKEQREIPKYQFAIMGGYDSLAGIMQTFAINYISNASLIVLVQQSAIPISMVISKYALNSSYSNMQYLGASIVLMGIVVVIIPNLLSPAPSTIESDPIVQLMWLLVLIVSCVPMCLSSVYKEKALGEVDIDIIYLNGWVAVFQFLIAIPLCFPTSEIQNLPIKDIIPNMYDGFKCWMGENSVTVDNNPYNLPLDDCSTAPLFVNTYLFFNVFYNFLIVVILKLGSANILYMASTVIVPLSNVAFSLKFVPGNQPLRSWDIVGLFVIMTGLVIYRFSSDILNTFNRMRGIVPPEEDILRLEKKTYTKKLLKDAELKQLRFVGLNQAESLQTMVDLRLSKEKSRLLFRSPQQIRGTLYNKIGIPPSPLISVSSKGLGISKKEGSQSARSNYLSTGRSPPVMLERAGSFKSSTTTTVSYLSKNTPMINNTNSANRTLVTTVSYGKNKK